MVAVEECTVCHFGETFAQLNVRKTPIAAKGSGFPCGDGTGNAGLFQLAAVKECIDP